MHLQYQVVQKKYNSYISIHVSKNMLSCYLSQYNVWLYIGANFTEHYFHAASSREICNPWPCVYGPLSGHYYDDCPGTIGSSGVIVITSDEDNTVAYGGTNTMRRHIYTNKALTPPCTPPHSEWLSEDSSSAGRKGTSATKTK